MSPSESRDAWTAVVLVFLPGLGVEVYWLREIELIAIYTMLVGGLNITFGYAGELALSQIASLATGAYLAGILSQHGVQDLAVDFVLANHPSGDAEHA